MSIQTELTRLTNAKAAIQTAIEGKGVTVPSGTLLDGMAALIEAIKTEKVITGTFTVESDTTSYNIDYLPQSVEEWPSWLIIIAEKDTKTEYFSFKGMWATRIIYSNVQQKHDYFSYSHSSTTYGYNSGTNKYYTPYVYSGEVLMTKLISCNPSGVSTDFLAGVTYRYYMGFG